MRRLKATVDAARAGATDAARPACARPTPPSAASRSENREVFKIVFGHGAAYNDVIRRAQALFAADIEETIREGIASRRVRPAARRRSPRRRSSAWRRSCSSWWTEHESVPIETLHETMTTLALRGLGPRATAEKGVHHG